MTDSGATSQSGPTPDPLSTVSRDIADVPSVEIISTAALHLMSAAAVNLGLAEDLPDHKDLDEARSLIDALAGLLDASAPSLGHHHAAPSATASAPCNSPSKKPARSPTPPAKAPARSTPARSAPPPPGADRRGPEPQGHHNPRRRDHPRGTPL